MFTLLISSLVMLAPSASAAEGESIATYVWDGEGSTNLASEAANWYQDIGGVVTNDVAPTSEGHVIFNATSTKDCTWDLDASVVTVNSLTLDDGYTGKLTQGDVDIGIGAGGFDQRGNIIGNLGYSWYIDGPYVRYAGGLKNVNFVISGDITSYDFTTLSSLTVSADITIKTLGSGRLAANNLTILPGVDVSIASGSYLFYYPSSSDSVFNNQGAISGLGEFYVHFSSGSNENIVWHPGAIDAPVSVVCRSTTSVPEHRTVSLGSDANFYRINVFSQHSDYTVTLDLNGHSLTADSVTVGNNGNILWGEGTHYIGSLDTSAGDSDFETSRIIMEQGGSAVLAPGQSFDRLEIASDDGRTASWTMTATGAQAPIVTGLKSGSYLWYLDGVEQGEIEAGEDGTIALSYMSTGLHELSVKPTSMTLAMDGLADAVGIIVALAVLSGLFGMLGRLKF